MTDPVMPTAGKKNTTMAVIAYIIFFIPLLTGDAQKDPFVKYHVKQGLVLFLLVIALNIINQILPFYMWWTINNLLSLGTLVLLILGIVNAANGKQQPLPVIGKFADVFKF
jgi:uncharacterized membrane protein